MGNKEISKESNSVANMPVIGIERSPYYTPVAFGVMLLALIFLFKSFLFSDKMLFGSDIFAAGVYHRAMLVDYFNAYGTIPQWNPHAFGGMPYVEAFHGDIFYPFSVMKFFVPLYFHLGFNLILHIFFAGVFMYLAARQFRLGKTAALFSAASYMFAAYLISMVASGHEGKIYVTALFPLVILLIERAFQQKPFFNFTLLGLILGIIILSPHPQMAYFTLWAAGLYTLYKLFVLYRSKKTIRLIPKPALLALYAVVVALLLSAIQFYPGYVYTTEFSPRAEAQSGWAWATSWSLHEEDLMSQLIPEFSGNTSITGTTYWGKNPFKYNSEAVGVVTLFMALIGLFFARRRERWFFGGLALFAIVYALGATTPIFKLFYYIIPKVGSLRAPAMIMFIYLFSVALLGGLGVQTIINWKNYNRPIRPKRLHYILAGIPLMLFTLAFLFTFAGHQMITWWTWLFYEGATEVYSVGRASRFDVAILNLASIQSGTWFAFFFAALAAVTIWVYLSGRVKIGLLTVLILLPVVDGVRFNHRFVKVVDPKIYFEPNPLSDFFLEQPGNFRVLNMEEVVPMSFLPLFGIDVVTGYHGNQLRWYDDLLGGRPAPYMSNPRFNNLVGTRYILVGVNAEIPPDYFGEFPVRTVERFKFFKIIQNDNALKRVYLVNNFEVIPDRQNIYPKILNGEDDLSRVVYLEKEPSIDIPPDSIGTDSAWVIAHAFDSVVVGVKCTANRLLVLNENYYDSWHVFIDGKPADLMRAYGTFRAVAVPEGTKQVTFRYHSERYARGKLITFVTSLYLLVVFGWYFVRGRFGRDEAVAE
ncbi:MAG: hypothetical protein IIC66_09915 [candidate division Zixibacteria bacterium]|nr:hypothetical protein [candidate division Zixibacteria bacterium]